MLMHTLCACMQVARAHVALQEVYLGPQHCDVASTLDVLQQTMSHLMANEPQVLIGLVPDWQTFSQVSKAQYAYAKRFKHVRALYARPAV